jgi:hypothetical protein
VARLAPANGADWDRFGVSVSICGDQVVVGAPWHDGEGLEDAGAAYLFARDAGGPGQWGQVAELTAGTRAAHDNFGDAVAISGDTILVGALADDEAASNAGAGYVFQLDAGGSGLWSRVARLTASDAAVADGFGSAVALDGDTAILGAPQDDDLGVYSGSAYVFQRVDGGAGGWQEIAKLTASDAAHDDRFGDSVSIAGDLAVVGAPSNSDEGWATGAVYVFRRHAGGKNRWGQVARLLATDADQQDYFGRSVALAGDAILIGAPGNYAPDTGSGAGYHFRRDEDGADSWRELARFTDAGGTPGDDFGRCAALDGDTALFGSPRDDDLAVDAGSAYVFSVGSPGTPYCSGDGSGTPCPCGNPGAGGNGCANGDFPAGCRLSTLGNAGVALDTLRLISTDSTPGQPGIFFQGDAPIAGGSGLPYGDGLRCAGGSLVRLQAVHSDALGRACTSVEPVQPVERARVELGPVTRIPASCSTKRAAARATPA